MSIFDTSSVEAGHRRLASSLSPQLEVLAASEELIRKALLFQDVPRGDQQNHADYLAVSQLGFRVANDLGAAMKLLDCGYFVQAASLLRDLCEIGMLALHFSIAPQDIRVWRSLNGQDQSNKFGPKALRKSLRPTLNEKLSYLDQRFRLFSDYGTHPSATSIIAHHDGERFQTGPHLNEGLYLTTYRELAHITWHVTDACGDAYCAIFQTSVEEILPAECQRFQLAWNGISAPEPQR
ncbi:hypothetical protein GH983_07360 [Agrobacterium sp. MA01]|uniref:hypothetical protein n=1 Tax=Agrobacterium sp. MA01 TaxID=2664893 RepID=UPI00129BF5BB|nr:hypothetical protein [Agrobacterium sp. MA01]QGG90295.1 hypothetical protein GH983_07360 [Agrobacterium sp. MA01]